MEAEHVAKAQAEDKAKQEGTEDPNHCWLCMTNPSLTLDSSCRRNGTNARRAREAEGGRGAKEGKGDGGKHFTHIPLLHRAHAYIFQAMHVAQEEAKNAEDQKKAKEMEVSV
jgi:hypothetical protein